MARKKLEVNPKQSQRLKQILKEQNKSQKWLAGQIHVSEKTVSTMVNGSSAVTPETADLILDLFPGNYRKEWLLGFDDYKNNKEYFEGTIKECQKEADLLYSGLLSFLKLSEYEIKRVYDKRDTLSDIIKYETCGFTISRDGKSITLDMLKFNQLANKINDYVDFELQHMISIDSD